MVLTSQQASETLGEVAAAQRKARQLQGYSKAAPHLLLWGLIWLVGYMGTEFLPASAGLLWLVLDVIGIGGSFLIGRASASPEVRPEQSVNFVIAAIAIGAFIGATYYVMQPTTGAQFGAFPALIIALLYIAVGTVAGRRWMITGIAVGALTVLGYAFMREHFMLWMAFVGGGALLLASAWMRRV
jgi:hypothetical protein